MGIISGGLTFKAYIVEGYDFRNINYEEWLSKLNKGKFKAINKEKSEKESFGFSDSKDIFLEELEFRNTFYDNYIHFNFRRDTLKMQKSVINHYIKEIEKTFTKKVTKRELKEIKARAEAKYIRELYPTIASYEIIWNVETGILYFFTQSRAVNDKFTEWFERNMELELTELETATFAATILNDEELVQFDKKSPSSLVSI